MLLGELGGLCLGFVGVQLGKPGSVASAPPVPFPPFSARSHALLPPMRAQSGHRWSQARTFQGWRPQPAGLSQAQVAEAPERWDRVETGLGREIGHSHGCREVAGRAR